MATIGSVSTSAKDGGYEGERKTLSVRANHHRPSGRPLRVVETSLTSA